MKAKPNYTAAQLIEELKKFPPEMPVVTSGYEGEYENILPLKIISVKYIPDEPYYNGQFQCVNEAEIDAFSVVAIEREVRPF